MKESIISPMLQPLTPVEPCLELEGMGHKVMGLMPHALGLMPYALGLGMGRACGDTSPRTNTPAHDARDQVDRMDPRARRLTPLDMRQQAVACANDLIHRCYALLTGLTPPNGPVKGP